ncbi:hypothetical protein BpHYR1_033032, partial [Brachionus plicatilis]
VRKDFLCAKGSSTYDLWWNDATKQCEYPCKIQCNKQIFGSSNSAAEVANMDRNLNSALCGADQNSNGNSGNQFGAYGNQFTQPALLDNLFNLSPHNHIILKKKVHEIQNFNKILNKSMIKLKNSIFLGAQLLAHFNMVCSDKYLYEQNVYQCQPSENSGYFAVNQDANPKPATLGPISRNENVMNTIPSNQASQTIQVMAN